MVGEWILQHMGFITMINIHLGDVGEMEGDEDKFPIHQEDNVLHKRSSLEETQWMGKMGSSVSKFDDNAF